MFVGDVQAVGPEPLLGVKKFVIGAWTRRRLVFGLLLALAGKELMEAMVASE